MRCSVPGCHEYFNTHIDRSGYSFFGFPLDQGQCAEWVRRICLDPHTINTSCSRICSKHFEKSQLKHNGNRLTKLKNAIPTLYLPNSSKKKPISTNDQFRAQDKPQPKTALKPKKKPLLACRRSTASSIVELEESTADTANSIRWEAIEEHEIKPTASKSAAKTMCRLCLIETQPYYTSVFDVFNATTKMTVSAAITELINLKVI